MARKWIGILLVGSLLVPELGQAAAARPVPPAASSPVLSSAFTDQALATMVPVMRKPFSVHVRVALIAMVMFASAGALRSAPIAPPPELKLLTVRGRRVSIQSLKSEFRLYSHEKDFRVARVWVPGAEGWHETEFGIFFPEGAEYWLTLDDQKPQALPTGAVTSKESTQWNGRFTRKDILKKALQSVLIGKIAVGETKNPPVSPYPLSALGIPTGQHTWIVPNEVMDAGTQAGITKPIRNVAARTLVGTEPLSEKAYEHLLSKLAVISPAMFDELKAMGPEGRQRFNEVYTVAGNIFMMASFTLLPSHVLSAFLHHEYFHRAWYQLPSKDRDLLEGIYAELNKDPSFGFALKFLLPAGYHGEIDSGEFAPDFWNFVARPVFPSKAQKQAFKKQAEAWLNAYKAHGAVEEKKLEDARRLINQLVNEVDRIGNEALKEALQKIPRDRIGLVRPATPARHVGRYRLLPAA